ncbi:MAG: hypothetical protein LQ348_001345 [Seirophora lacunosa]|nr:MAG: hypothetical protein LQ348_001345 [Seirophora lacunosa]
MTPTPPGGPRPYPYGQGNLDIVQRTWHQLGHYSLGRDMYSTAAARANQAKGENNAFNKESRHGRSETDGGTAAFLQLPLSPLIDPKLQAARNRYKARKPEPSREPSEFQKKLAKNPYALALATPVRNCAITGVRLPNQFLLDFGLAPHPRTGKPWQMPRLVLDSNVTVLGEATSSTHTSQLPTTTSSNTDPGAMFPSRRPARPVAGSYIVSQRNAVKFMSEIRRRSYMQMVPYRWKLDTRFKTDNIVWREDMDEFVLDLMRRKVFRLLGYLSSRPAAYITACHKYQDIQKKHQPGAVLWLGNPNGDENTKEEPPPPYAMVKYRSAGNIPVYNLPMLLGPYFLDQLRGSKELFGGALVVIKQKRNSLESLMHLWKMMGYITSDADNRQ